MNIFALLNLLLILLFVARMALNHRNRERRFPVRGGQLILYTRTAGPTLARMHCHGGRRPVRTVTLARYPDGPARSELERQTEFHCIPDRAIRIAALLLGTTPDGKVLLADPTRGPRITPEGPRFVTDYTQDIRTASGDLVVVHEATGGVLVTERLSYFRERLIKYKLMSPVTPEKAVKWFSRCRKLPARGEPRIESCQSPSGNFTVYRVAKPNPVP